MKKNRLIKKAQV